MNIAEQIKDCPPGSKIIIIVAVLASLVNTVSSTFQWFFALNLSRVLYPPSNLLPLPFLWQVFTCNFFEEHALKGFVIWPLLLSLSMELERGWGTRRFLCFIAWAGVFGGFCAIVVRVIHYAVTYNTDAFFDSTSGSCGIVVALVVACRHENHWRDQFAGIKFPRAIAVNFHLAFMAVWIVLRMLFPSGFRDWIFLPSAMWASWFWIRYIAYEAGLGQVGDMSEDWLFCELFPKWARPVMVPLSNFTHVFCTPCRKMWLVRFSYSMTQCNVSKIIQHCPTSFICSIIFVLNPKNKNSRNPPNPNGQIPLTQHPDSTQPTIKRDVTGR